MKIVYRKINRRNNAGEVVVIPYTEDDIWYLYNILAPGDVIRTVADRKVKTHEGEFDRVKVARKKLVLTTIVLAVSFQNDEKGTSLVLRTRNLSQNDFVAIGQIQSTEVRLGERLSIVKQTWTARYLSLLDEAVEQVNRSDTLVLLFDDGYAAFFFLKDNFTRLHTKLTATMPRKKGGLAEVFKRKAEEFDRKVWCTLMSIDTDMLNLIVLAGPGTAKKRLLTRFTEFADAELDSRVQYRARQILPKVSLVTISTTHKAALDEVLKNPVIADRLSDTRAVREVRKLEEFFTALNYNANCAVYGLEEVEFAAREGAVKTLLITDGLLRSHDFARRGRIARLVDSVTRQGAEVFEFHEDHSSGRKLREITGVAAVLRYAVQLEGTFDHGEYDDPDATPIINENARIQDEEMAAVLREGDEKVFNEEEDLM